MKRKSVTFSLPPETIDQLAELTGDGVLPVSKSAVIALAIEKLAAERKAVRNQMATSVGARALELMFGGEI